MRVRISRRCADGYRKEARHDRRLADDVSAAVDMLSRDPGSGRRMQGYRQHEIMRLEILPQRLRIIYLVQPGAVLVVWIGRRKTVYKRFGAYYRQHEAGFEGHVSRNSMDWADVPAPRGASRAAGESVRCSLCGQEFAASDPAIAIRKRRHEEFHLRDARLNIIYGRAEWSAVEDS